MSDPLRVVIVDDTDDIRELVTIVLQRTGRYEVVGQAANGQEGVNAVVAERPDLVLLDLSMPVMDGLEALPLIRQRVPDATVVVLSGYPDSVAGEAARSAGASGYLEKTDLMRSFEPSLAALLDLPTQRDG